MVRENGQSGVEHTPEVAQGRVESRKAVHWEMRCQSTLLELTSMPVAQKREKG